MVLVGGGMVVFIVIIAVVKTVEWCWRICRGGGYGGICSEMVLVERCWWLWDVRIGGNCGSEVIFVHFNIYAFTFTNLVQIK